MTFLEKVCSCFEAQNIAYAIVGGYAVALHGAARGTVDVDFIVNHKEKTFIAVEAALKSIGLVSRLPVTAREVFQFRKEYIEKRNLIAWSFYHPRNPVDIVDIIITDNIEDFSVIEKKMANSTIKVLSKSDLIKMKKKSGRPQDLLDIEALEKL